jgi:hypothetical protein
MSKKLGAKIRKEYHSGKFFKTGVFYLMFFMENEQRLTK